MRIGRVICPWQVKSSSPSSPSRQTSQVVIDKYVCQENVEANAGNQCTAERPHSFKTTDQKSSENVLREIYLNCRKHTVIASDPNRRRFTFKHCNFGYAT